MSAADSVHAVDAVAADGGAAEGDDVDGYDVPGMGTDRAAQSCSALMSDSDEF